MFKSKDPLVIALAIGGGVPICLIPIGLALSDSHSRDITGAITTIVFLLVIAALYFLPALHAWHRGHHNTSAIFVLNLLAGWTFVGWVAAAVWACTRLPSRAI